MPAPGARGPGASGQLHWERGHPDRQGPDRGGQAGELPHERVGQKEGEGMGLADMFSGKVGCCIAAQLSQLRQTELISEIF